MKKEFLSSFLLFVWVLILASIASAQQPQTKSYVLGEVLTYEGKFSKIIKGIAVADLTFKVENAPNGKDYLIKSEAKSKGTLVKLVRFSFLQQIQSTVDSIKLHVLKSVKHDAQNDRIRDSEAVFDYDNKKVTYTETDPTDPMRAPRKVASEVGANAQDLVSGVYSLRSLPLAVGKTFEVTVSDSGLVYKVPVHVTARVRQKSIFGKIWCFRLEPEVFGEKRLIEQKGSLIIWITDDARRIPIRGQVNANIGRVEIKLKSISYTPKR